MAFEVKKESCLALSALFFLSKNRTLLLLKLIVYYLCICQFNFKSKKDNDLKILYFILVRKEKDLLKKHQLKI
jgi:hypothetical protein